MKLILKQETKTSNGVLSKGIYKDENNVNYLVKGTTFGGYEAVSEVIAYNVACALGLSCVEYKIKSGKEYPEVNTDSYVSVCKFDKTPHGYQHLSAIKLMELYYKREINEDYWGLFTDMFDYPKDILDMLVFDAIIGNNDRHLNNWDYYVFQGENGLMFKQTPIFDNGSSLVPDCDISKPFKSTHKLQTELIKKRYPYYKLDIVGDVNELLDKIEPYLWLIPENRGIAVKEYLRERYIRYTEMFL